MAPDKIVIMDGEIHRTEQTYINDIEYIRKDALLEWINGKYNEYKQMDEDFQGDVFIGNRHALAEVIAKIESL